MTEFWPLAIGLLAAIGLIVAMKSLGIRGG